ncbi:hydrolase alpha/beta fold protein [Toxoplasma gondii FOU]|uniref:Hydrolase alpha/beta fold protein n=3 Tax=Toxoplasma gondii TaxID=5811 RepID=A0A086JZA9_TOXGO|nr:hydrolase alpha/beta fold protein [Toxoplasma gondii FOU]PUA84958.1 hydrolase alpha/beta fold protein [Toxoplasma gondii TgCATBr9]RQX68385.1 hydrolase alpha/beta fold protein [Toxoplasma gondii CAST]
MFPLRFLFLCSSSFTLAASPLSSVAPVSPPSCFSSFLPTWLFPLSASSWARRVTGLAAPHGRNFRLDEVSPLTETLLLRGLSVPQCLRGSRAWSPPLALSLTAQATMRSSRSAGAAADGVLRAVSPPLGVESFAKQSCAPTSRGASTAVSFLSSSPPHTLPSPPGSPRRFCLEGGGNSHEVDGGRSPIASAVSLAARGDESERPVSVEYRPTRLPAARQKAKRPSQWPSCLLSRAVDLAFEEVIPGPSSSWEGSEKRASLVVVLHGMFRGKEDMRDLCRRLHADRVLAVDLRNHGASPSTSSMFLQDMAADVIALIQREKRIAVKPPTSREHTRDTKEEEELAEATGGERRRGRKEEREQGRQGDGERGKREDQEGRSKELAGETCNGYGLSGGDMPLLGRDLESRPSLVSDDSGWNSRPPSSDGLVPGCCCLVGHSLGGQVAMAAALRAPQGLIQSVVALDISPVNYYRWPLPRAGSVDIRDLVELAAALPTEAVPDGKRGVVRALEEREPPLRHGGADSLLVLLEEEGNALGDEEKDKETRGEGEEERAARSHDAATREAGMAGLWPARPAEEERQKGRMAEREGDKEERESDRYGSHAQTSESGVRGVEKPVPRKNLKWKMNIQVIRDSFRNETLKWDLPAALPASASTTGASPFSSSALSSFRPFSPCCSATASSPQASSPFSSSPLTTSSSAADSSPTSRAAHASVAVFQEAPTAFLGPALIVRGLASPWVDVERHWPSVKNYFPYAHSLVVEAGHAVHIDQPALTAAAINDLLKVVLNQRETSKSLCRDGR